jgi:hypothetical protein
MVRGLHPVTVTSSAKIKTNAQAPFFIANLLLLGAKTPGSAKVFPNFSES